MNFDKKCKRKAIFEIKKGLKLNSPEKKLWFAVIERAILDIGVRSLLSREDTSAGIVRPYRRKAFVNSDYFFRNKKDLKIILDFIDLNHSFFFKILKKHSIWPILDENYYKPVKGV